LGTSSVEVRHLVKVHGDVVVLNSIDLSISKGRLFALIGPNGAGKTTLLRIIAGLNKPTSGEVWINGVLGVLGLCFRIGLYPRMTVYDNVALPLRVRHVHRLQVDRSVRLIAEELEISDLLI